MKLRHEPGIPFADEKVDAVLIGGPENVRYLTGFTGSNGMVLLFRDREPVFLTDPRYTIQARKEVPCRIRVVARGGLLAGAAAYLNRLKMRRIGFEKHHLFFGLYEKLKNSLEVRAELKPLENYIEVRRMVKDSAELAAIRDAVAINSRAFDRALRKIRPGVTEKELAAEIEYQMRRLGAERPSFETIVAFGERTALPHASPTNRKLKGNELVLIDMGAFRNGYASDMTRTLHLGRPPVRIRRMYDAVLEAQLAGIEAVRQGVTAGRVDSAARKVLRRHGLDRMFTHSTGHGLGLEIHEAPRLGKGDDTPLMAGMAITIEPGVYIKGVGGIRIEDTVAVTQSGSEVLTPTTKELFVI